MCLSGIISNVPQLVFFFFLRKYPNLLGTKGFVVAVVEMTAIWICQIVFCDSNVYLIKLQGYKTASNI